MKDEIDEIAAKDRMFVTALARGLQVLQSFQTGDEVLTNAELSKRTDLPRPTVSRLTHTLTVLGYLTAHGDKGGYSIHPHILSLGYPVLAHLDVRTIARPMMQALADHAGGSVALGIRDGLSMILVERTRNRAVITLPLEIGSRIPLAITSMGRAYLAALNDQKREQLLEEIRQSGPEEWWPSILSAIEQEMIRYREFGYCQSIGEWETDVNGVGVPLILPDGTIMAFNCGGPASRIRKERLPDLGQRLVELARTVGIAKGVEPPVQPQYV